MHPANMPAICRRRKLFPAPRKQSIHSSPWASQGSSMHACGDQQHAPNQCRAARYDAGSIAMHNPTLLRVVSGTTQAWTRNQKGMHNICVPVVGPHYGPTQPISCMGTHQSSRRSFALSSTPQSLHPSPVEQSRDRPCPAAPLTSLAETLQQNCVPPAAQQAGVHAWHTPCIATG